MAIPVTTGCSFRRARNVTVAKTCYVTRRHRVVDTSLIASGLSGLSTDKGGVQCMTEMVTTIGTLRYLSMSHARSTVVYIFSSDLHGPSGASPVGLTLSYSTSMGLAVCIPCDGCAACRLWHACIVRRVALLWCGCPRLYT